MKKIINIKLDECLLMISMKSLFAPGTRAIVLCPAMCDRVVCGFMSKGACEVCEEMSVTAVLQVLALERNMNSTVAMKIVKQQQA